MHYSPISTEMAAPVCDLFDIEPGYLGPDGTGGMKAKTKTLPGRAATEDECMAYADFLRRRAGLPDYGACRLRWEVIGNGRNAHRYCVGATFTYENDHDLERGGFSIMLPGANMMRAKVTMETLDESGTVVASSTMPVEPKKGGVIWKAAEVKAAHGPKGTPIPNECARLSEATEVHTPIEATEAEAFGPALFVRILQGGYDNAEAKVIRMGGIGAFGSWVAVTNCGRHLALDMGSEGGQWERLRAHPPAHTPENERELAPVSGEAQSAIVNLAPSGVEQGAHSEPEPHVADPMAAIEARMAAMERHLASLSGERPVPPSAATERPKRSAAHERAVRRAWAERKSRRLAMAVAEDHMRMREQMQAELATSQRKRGKAVLQARDARKQGRRWKGAYRVTSAYADTLQRKRRSNAMLARKRTRDMVLAVNAMHDQLDAVTTERDKARIAPTYFAGEDGIERLDLASRNAAHATRERERAEALQRRLAVAEQRAQRAEAAANRGADIIEAMGADLAMAKARLRKAFPGPVLAAVPAVPVPEAA